MNLKVSLKKYGPKKDPTKSVNNAPLRNLGQRGHNIFVGSTKCLYKVLNFRSFKFTVICPQSKKSSNRGLKGSLRTP